MTTSDPPSKVPEQPDTLKQYSGASQMPPGRLDQLVKQIGEAAIANLTEAAEQHKAEQESKPLDQPLQSPKYYAKASDMPKEEWDALVQSMAQAFVDGLNEAIEADKAEPDPTKRRLTS